MSNTNDFKAPTHSSSKKGSYGLVSKSEDENSDVKKKKEVLMGPDGEQIPLQYDVPFWSHAPCFPYTLEILKDGKIIEVVNIHEKGYYLVGRIPVCDIVLEHPVSFYIIFHCSLLRCYPIYLTLILEHFKTTCDHTS